MGVFDHGMIELTAGDELNVFAGVQRLIGLDVAVRADESDLHAGIGFFDFADELQSLSKPTVEVNRTRNS